MARCGPLGTISLSALTHLPGNALSQYLYPDIPFLNVGKLSSEPGRTLGAGGEAEHKHERAQTTAPNLVVDTFFLSRATAASAISHAGLSSTHDLTISRSCDAVTLKTGTSGRIASVWVSHFRCPRYFRTSSNRSFRPAAGNWP